MTGIGVGPLADAQTVAQAFAAGVGSRIQGVARQQGAAGPAGAAAAASGPASDRAHRWADGRFRITGPIYHRRDRGTWAPPRCWHTRPSPRWSASGRWSRSIWRCSRASGVDPRGFDFLLLKSRMYCRPTFVPISGGLSSATAAHVQLRLRAVRFEKAAAADLSARPAGGLRRALVRAHRVTTANALMLTIRRTVAAGVRMCTGFAAPSRIAPTVMPWPETVRTTL